MRTDVSKPRLVTLVVAVTLLLIGCGVSGTPSSNASASTAPGTTATTASTLPETTDTTATTATTETTVPEGGSGDTTIPGSSDTTTPNQTNPFGSGDIKRTLIQIYKQSGFTNKEATCVADLIVKESGGGTIDPSKLDVLKLGRAARRCFGADGVPGGSD